MKRLCWLISIFTATCGLGPSAQFSCGQLLAESPQEGTQEKSDQTQLIEGQIEEVVNDYGFTEGPLWLPDQGCFVFSDIPNDTIYREDGSIFRKPSGKSNGLTLDRQGRLVVCEHWNRRVLRVEPDGQETVLAQRYQGKLLNSPNDLIVRSDGTIFFSDPPFGLMYFGPKRDAELDVNGVYRIALDGSLTRVIDDMKMPNGLAFSPDEKTLYVSDDIDEGYVRTYDIAPDGSLSNPRLFADGLEPDGIKVDVEGNLWCTSRYEVVVFRPDGSQLGSITFPQKTANLAFGGPDSRTLMVTARKGVYRVRTTIPGIHPK
jgi:gluconolactonase